MEYQYPHNDHKTMITYMRNKTGKNWFRVYYNNTSCIRFTPLEVGFELGITLYVNELRDWCEEMVTKYETQPEIEQMEDRGDKARETKAKVKGCMVI